MAFEKDAPKAARSSALRYGGEISGHLHFNVGMCRLTHAECNMATNLALNSSLLDRAVAVSGESTKRAVVTLALEEFIARR